MTGEEFQQAMAHMQALAAEVAALKAAAAPPAPQAPTAPAPTVSLSQALAAIAPTAPAPVTAPVSAAPLKDALGTIRRLVGEDRSRELLRAEGLMDDSIANAVPIIDVVRAVQYKHWFTAGSKAVYQLAAGAISVGFATGRIAFVGK
jgi:hypothetical protein